MLQRAGLESGMCVCCNLCVQWVCLLHPALGGECTGMEGRRATEGFRTPGSLRMAHRKAGPETFITTTAGERLSFGCAGPTKIILFMCFQALKNSFRAHQ